MREGKDGWFTSTCTVLGQDEGTNLKDGRGRGEGGEDEATIEGWEKERERGY